MHGCIEGNRLMRRGHVYGRGDVRERSPITYGKEKNKNSRRK